jgi:hypothetical protein
VTAPAVEGATHTTLAETGVDDARVSRIVGQALCAAPRQNGLDHPRLAHLVEAHDPVAGGGVQPQV